MSESPTPASPKSRFPIWLLVIGCLALMILALSFGGFVFWVLRQPVPAPVAADSAARVAGDTVEMFNGRDLEGWDYDPAVWSVRDGVIHGSQQARGAGSALIWPDSDVADFELRFSFRLIRGNSGVGYRATRLPNLDVGGYEFEIYTNKTGNLANVGTDRQRYRLHRADDTAEPTDSEWHEAVITARDTHLVHVLDGKTLCDLKDTNPAAPRAGVIAFGMSTGAAAEFKDIRLTRFVTRP